MMRKFRTRIIDSEFMTPNMYRLVIERPEGFDYFPGQTIAVHMSGDRRFYSLVSHPDEGNLELGIKVKRGGKFSDTLHSMEGEEIEISGPYGMLHKHITGRRIAILAIGSGIAPLISVLKDISKRGCCEVMLAYGEKDEEHLPYREFLSGLGDWFRMVVAFSNSGVHVQDLFDEIRWFSPDTVIGIGNMRFVSDVRKAFEGFNVFVEGFG